MASRVKIGIRSMFTGSFTRRYFATASFLRTPTGYTASSALFDALTQHVALSAADGYARITGRAQAVIIHTDVGTQALGCAIHNAHVGRTPVFIFAGMCPSTDDGVLRGSRTEYSHWYQEPRDQKAIVDQYCRYTAEVKQGRTMKELVARGMQFAMSDTKGPVYLCATREVLEEEVEDRPLDMTRWVPVSPAALPSDAVKSLAQALIHAKYPLIITGFSGRNLSFPLELVKLADAIPGLQVLDTAGSDVCFPADHPAYVGMSYSFDDVTTKADVILLLDCPIPWIPSRNPPRPDARIYQIDTDPLCASMPITFFPAHARYRADSYTALRQLNTHIRTSPPLLHILSQPYFQSRATTLTTLRSKRISETLALCTPNIDGSINFFHLAQMIRDTLPKETYYAIEAVTNAVPLARILAPTRPGKWLNCGGTGLGWSGGASLGMYLALTSSTQTLQSPPLITQIVGDGTYLATHPSSVYWLSSRYSLPFLTIILNNGGWNAPRNSLLLVHPEGEAAGLTREEIGVSLEPVGDLMGVARAAAGRFRCSDGGKGGGKEMFARRVERADEVEEVLREARDSVREGVGAVVEVRLSEG